jgi:hypothetical protein
MQKREHQVPTPREVEERRTLFTGTEAKDLATMQHAAKEHSVWINSDIGYCKLGDVLSGLFTLFIPREESARADKTKADINACMLKTYNKEFDYLQRLYDQVLDIDSPIDATLLQH